MYILNALLLILALPAVLACAYLAVLTLLSGSLSVPQRSSRKLRFDVIVPAHNEELLIARTLASLGRMDWPSDGLRLWVIADNCADSTAARAREAGARVLERRDMSLRGKGHALKVAFTNSLQSGWADAVVIIDADTEVSVNLLEAFASRLESGAEAVQACYGVLNPLASWRTRLATMALACIHDLRSRARERMRLSCGIRGNGWCVTSNILRQLPYQSYSLTEDLEYGIALGLAGHRVHYADEARADAEMAMGSVTAGTQRQRWEDGRLLLVGQKTLPLLRDALRRHSAVCLDLALDLLVLPLSYIALNVTALLFACAVAASLKMASADWLWIGAACIGGLSLYVLRGWQLSGLGRQGLYALGQIPLYVVWKSWVMLQRRDSGKWIRTGRNYE